MLKAIEHTAIIADDTAALAQWYMDTLGFELVLKDEKYGAYFLRLPGGGMLEFLPSNKKARGTFAADDAGMRHIAFTVDDFDGAHKALAAKGVRYVGPYREAANGTRMDFFPDPEGNLLQLIYRPTPLGG